MTKIINLFGAPGAGKSTLAAGLFYIMKQAGKKVELVTEFAKEKVYDNALDVMSDQLYLLAKQNRRLDRLIGKVDYVITDSPLLLCAYYGEKYGRHPEIVCPTSAALFHKYDNLNYYIVRTKEFKSYGRLGTEVQSNSASVDILKILNDYNIQYEAIDSSTTNEAVFTDITVKCGE